MSVSRVIILGRRHMAVHYSQTATAAVIPIPVAIFTSGTTAAAALQSALSVNGDFTAAKGITVSIDVFAGVLCGNIKAYTVPLPTTKASKTPLIIRLLFVGAFKPTWTLKGTARIQLASATGC